MTLKKSFLPQFNWVKCSLRAETVLSTSVRPVPSAALRTWEGFKSDGRMGKETGALDPWVHGWMHGWMDG